MQVLPEMGKPRQLHSEVQVMGAKLVGVGVLRVTRFLKQGFYKVHGVRRVGCN